MIITSDWFLHIFTIYLFHFLGGIGAGQAQGGEAKKDRNGLWHGRNPQRGNQRVQGNSNVSIMQSKAKGRCTNQMLPLFLLRLPAYPLRNSSEKMPQVQCGFWCQRLSPPLFGLKSVVHFSLFTFSKIWTTAPKHQGPSPCRHNKQTNTVGVDRIKTPHFCSLAKCALFEEKQHNITKKTILLLILFSQWFILMNLIRKRCQFQALQINDFETFFDKWRQKQKKS